MKKKHYVTSHVTSMAGVTSHVATHSRRE